MSLSCGIFPDCESGRGINHRHRKAKANNRKQANETSLNKEGLNCSLDREESEQNKYTPPAEDMVP